MLKEILRLNGTQILNRNEQSNLRGGSIGCPDPIGDGDNNGGGGGGGGNSNIGVCFENGNIVRVPCDRLCSNGTQPICGF